MDINDDDGRLPLSPPQPQPLRIRKQSNPVHVSRSEQQLNKYNPSKQSINTDFPPRTSSLRRYDNPDASGQPSLRENCHNRQDSNNSSIVRSTLASGEIFDNSLVHSPSTERSTLLSYKEPHLSDSSHIIGNFVPMTTDAPAMAFQPRKTEHSAGFFDTSPGPNSAAHVANPYEFEPESPYVDHDRQTTISVFMDVPAGSQNPHRVSHLKNSHSEGGTVTMTRSASPLKVQPSKPFEHIIRRQRSESSPRLTDSPARFASLVIPQSKPVSQVIHRQRSESSPRFTEPSARFTPLRSPERQDRSPSPDISSYYAEGEECDSPVRRGRSPFRIVAARGGQYQDGNIPVAFDRSLDEDSQSPSRLPRPINTNKSEPNSASPNRNRIRSPTKTLEDLVEREEYDESNIELLLSPTPRSRKKRSRSPMKKMFGEHGWLGRTPDELEVGKTPPKKSSHGRKEKKSVMGKLRIKIGEFAEKADLSPIGRATRAQEKHPKLSVLSVSLGPPEQARIYMETELMLVHTANSFLMNQFSQGRMSMDSIKKTVDTWKARGRPIVTEFMYDQATQRDLVAINQHNLRFHGDKAADSVRVNAMLYNWKQVASLMAIRTFCDADTVILKLLFDIEQVLELLGAGEPILLRLQQIRASANEMMRVARSKAQCHKGPREQTWNSQSSTTDSSRSQSTDDPYGGMKLVPESYHG